MTTTPYALQVKLDLLLQDHTPVPLPGGAEAWSFEPDFHLVWIDALRITHLCEVPPSPMPIDFRPRTLCGHAVATSYLRLAEQDEFGAPTCPDCFRENLRRFTNALLDDTTAPEPIPDVAA